MTDEKKDGVEFKTEDAQVKGRKGKLDPTDEEILRQAERADSAVARGVDPASEGLIPINSIEDLQDLVKAANETYKSFEKQVADMTRKEAREVRRVRVDEGYSWRAVARHFHDLGDFGEFSPPSNQLAGMALCERAAKHFGEDYMSPPWNG